MHRAFVAVVVALCALPAVAGMRDQDLAAIEHREEARALRAVALAAVREENNLLVAASDYALPGIGISEAASGTYWDTRIADLRDRRRVLAEHGLAYTTAKTELTVESVEVSDDTAILTATETAELTLTERATGAVVTTTVFSVPHRFELARENGAWRLVGDTAAPEFVALPQEADAPALHGPTDGPIVDGAIVANAAVPRLNRSKVVSYALSYVGKNRTGTVGYNGAYRAFSSDCTNFVSQALYDGGWTQVTGFYTSSSAWWYNWANQSRPWINAQQWAEFTQSRPRGYLVSTIGQLQLGDILQADFDDRYPMEHSTIVTGKDSAGTPLLTYHSENNKNVSFWEFDRRVKLSYKNVRYYRWHLYDTIY
jgi:hypothetical protein